MRPLPLLALGLGLAACAAPPEEPVSVARASQPIFGGAPPDAPEHAAVVGLHQRSSAGVAVSPFCSGTLVAPSVVLTAAHCLDVARSGKRTFQTMSPAAVAIYVGDQAAIDPAPRVFAVVETLIHPQYNRFSNRNDIGLIRLAGPVDGVDPVPALPAAQGFTAADVGEIVGFAGFGLTEDGTLGEKLQVDLPLGGLGCSVPGCPSPGDAATMVSYVQPDGGPCSGDSGGPLFIVRGGQPYVGAVTSYGDAGCTIYGVSARADAAEGLIRDFIGVPPPPCGADGVCDAACAADPDCAPPPAGDCGDGVCGEGESCDGRAGTQACGDCAGLTGGKPNRRFCVVEGVCEGPGC